MEKQKSNVLAIIVMILLAAIYASTQNKNFYSINNIRNLLSNTAVRFIIACGVSGCLMPQEHGLISHILASRLK